MSANESIEMDSMPSSTSDLKKFIKKSESHAETINEADRGDIHEMNELTDVESPLLENSSPLRAGEDIALLPMSPSDLNRMDEIENTFKVDDNYREQGNSSEQVSLVANLDNLESQEESRPVISEMLLRITELASDYYEFIIGGIILTLLLIFALAVLPKCFHSLYYDEYALSRSSLTGKVDDENVYEPGWHFMSPFNEWIKFHKTVHAVTLNNVKIYTTDQLMLKATFGVYYFLE